MAPMDSGAGQGGRGRSLTMRMLVVLLVGVVAALATGATAQAATVPPGAGAGHAGGPGRHQPSGAMTASTSTHSDHSPPLASIPALAPGSSQAPRRVREHLPRPRLVAYQADPVVQSAAPTLAAPSSTSFEGISQATQGPVSGYDVTPPDTEGAVGPSDYVQWVNLAFEIFNKSGQSLYGPAAGNTLWSGFGGLCQTANEGDPIVRYDALADRWVFSQFAFTVDSSGTPTGPFDQCFAVSSSPDPLGSYYRYSFEISSSDLNDYPKLGIWPDAYYLSVDLFSGNTYVGPEALAFDRAAMLSGAPAATVLSTTLASSYGPILPADLDGTTPPLSGEPEYFASTDTSSTTDSTIYLWQFHADFATPANSTFTALPNLTTASYNLAICAHGSSTDCVPQPGTTTLLDTLGDRPMYRLAYRNFATYESLVFDQTVNVASRGGFQAAPRWYEVRVSPPSTASTPGTASIFQQGTFAPDASNRWMGSTAMDHSGDLAIGYSLDNSNSIYPSIAYAGRLSTDPLNYLSQGEAIMTTGGGSQVGSSRWGDYSTLNIDPSDDCTFWYTDEYYSTNGTGATNINWQTRIGSFRFSACKSPQIDVSPTAVDFGNQTVGTPVTRTLTVTNAGAQTLDVAAPSLSGANPTDFSVSPSTSFTVAPGTSANVQVSFTPGALAARSATLSLSNNASLHPTLVDLSGTGIQTPGAITGVVSNGTAGLANICVTAYTPSDENGGATTTNSSGAYTLSGLAPGLWRLRFIDCSATPTYAAQWYSGAADFASASAVTVNSGATTSAIDVTMATGGSITGTVTSGGSPAGAGSVCIYAFVAYPYGTFVGQTTTTGSGGAFSLGGLGLGSYDLQISDCAPVGVDASQWYSAQTDFSSSDTPVTLTSNTPSQALGTIALATGGYASGTVTSASTGMPVAGACVVAFGPGGSYISKTTTATDGSYTLSKLTPGTGTAKIRVTDCAGSGALATQWYGGGYDLTTATAINVTGGSTTTGLNVSLEPAGYVTGTVTDASSTQPLANICAFAYSTHDQWIATATTDATGTYQLVGLPAGSVYVYFSDCNGSGAHSAQWYNNTSTGASSYTSALAVTVTAGTTTSGINASLSP